MTIAPLIDFRVERLRNTSLVCSTTPGYSVVMKFHNATSSNSVKTITLLSTYQLRLLQNVTLVSNALPR